MLKVLVTGAAGFIGSFVSRRLLERGDEVVGLDNINDYYDTALKYGRLGFLGVEGDIRWNEPVRSGKYDKFRFVRMNLEDRKAMHELFAGERFDAVVNLAAQAGVRYSLKNPYAYVESNVYGFLNVLEGCRTGGVKHLVYASSSSVYGLNGKVPFSEHDGIAQRYSQLVFCCFLHFCMVIDIFDIFHDIKCKILFFIVIIAVIRSQNFLPDFFSI